MKRDTTLKNKAACAGEEIYLGEFDDIEIELVAFFHELGHIHLWRLFPNLKQTLSVATREGAAWELGFGLASNHGLKWDYYSSVKYWARKQFMTYLK